MRNATTKNEIRVDQGKPKMKLPKLKIGIYSGAKLVRVVEVEDPRERIIETFNREFQCTGLVAVD